MLRASAKSGGHEDGGQLVVVFARWVLIVGGLLLLLWNPTQADLNRIRVGLAVVLAMAVGNFYLHVQVALGKGVLPTLLYAASFVDVTVVTLITGVYGGFGSGAFVFYFPAIIAASLAFPLEVTGGLAGWALFLYVTMAVPDVMTQADGQVLFERVIALAGVAAVAALFPARARAGRGLTGPRAGVTSQPRVDPPSGDAV